MWGTGSSKEGQGFWRTNSNNSSHSVWTMNVQTQDYGDEIETMRDGSVSAASLEDDDFSVPKSRPKLVIPQRSQVKGQEAAAVPSSSTCDLVDGTWVCHPYKIELLERQLFSNTPGEARRTAIIETLRSRKNMYLLQS